MSITPCMCCDDDYEETPDTYCEICGNDCCESCLEGHVCKDCIGQHNSEFQRNERWQKMTDSEREAEIESARAA
jgi:hypothetical protein